MNSSPNPFYCKKKGNKIYILKEAVSNVKKTELSFPRKWESILNCGFWILVFTGMTHKTRLLKQPLRACPKFISAVSYCILILIILINSKVTFSQQKDSLSILSDSVGNAIDSLFVSSDTIINPVDSLFNAKPKGKAYDVDTTVFASAKDSLIFLVKDKKMKIYGEGSINYKKNKIKR